MTNNLVVADADALVALVLDEDPHHKLATKINNNFTQNGVIIIIPNTALMEAITALKRGLNQPEKAHLINRKYLQDNFTVEYITDEIQKRASRIFEEKAVSKKNTIFDCIVAATAEKLGTNSIFSFDKWYTKLGFKLA